MTQWGYDSKFVAEGIKYIESTLSDLSIEQLAQTIADFTNQNPDCNFKLMSQEIIGFLGNIVEAGGNLDAREEVTIKNIEAIFKSAHKFSLRKKMRGGWGSIKEKIASLISRRKSAKDD